MILFIRTLYLDNWKCFSEPLEMSFNTIEIFSFPNGAGKTSVLEAIYFGIWGKTDNKLSTYQNHDGQTKIVIDFEILGISYKIVREFPKTSAILYKNGEIFKRGAREILSFIESIFPYTLVKKLWFKGDVAESDILNFNFFKDEILAERLHDPLILGKYYSQIARQKQRDANNISIQEDIRELKFIDINIDVITSQIKKKSSVNSYQYYNALQAKEAKEKLKEIPTLVSQSDISRWNTINETQVKQALEQEKQKFVDKTLSSLSHQVLQSVYFANNNQGKCTICDGEWTNKRRTYIESILSTGFKSDTLIKQLEDTLAFKKQFTQEQIDESVQYYVLKNKIDSCPQWQSILEEYNEENNKLWDQLDTLKREREQALLNQEKIKQKSKLLDEVKDAKEKAGFIQTYIDKATEYYTQTLLSKASAKLHEINEDYNDITISTEDNSLLVSVRENKLSVGQLSRGEKTMVALSLITTIRDIFAPSMPLIFDESFASLSENNNTQVIEILKDSDEQLFVVSHNPKWITYPNYNDNTTVRSSWA